jgi:hypothetical protein
MSVVYYATPLSTALFSYQPINPIYMAGGKLSPLQRWLGSTIDFDQIIAIHDAYHIDRMGYGGHFVAISIEVVGGNPIHREWGLETHCTTITEDEYNKNLNYNYKRGNSFYSYKYTIQEDVKKCQEIIINDLLKYWRLYKEGLHV